MNETSIRVEQVGKRYRLGRTQTARYRTLREELLQLPRRLLASFGSGAEPADEFWALRDVSFEVKRGEVLGVIGRNGAGKSTLLKILSRIVDPTSGGADLYGRIGSLLEVGTGFHPELTGRENIYLSGAMLGMSRREVNARLDEIVAFAEVEKFLDTACKHYSSGMYLRLGFAVAAHLNTEILLVDEVLAVGDAAFQRKCVGKMAEAADGGRTVLFVSHNLGAVGSLCSRVLWLDQGRLRRDGPGREVIEAYLSDVTSGAGGVVTAAAPAGPAWITSACLTDRGGLPRQAFSMTELLRVECEYQVEQPGGFTLSLQVKEFDFSPVVHCTSGDAGFAVPGAAGRHRLAAEVPGLQLYPGRYWLRLALTHTATGVQHELDGIGFQVEQDFALCSRPLPRQAGLFYRAATWAMLPPPSP